MARASEAGRPAATHAATHAAALPPNPGFSGRPVGFQAEKLNRPLHVKGGSHEAVIAVRRLNLERVSGGDAALNPAVDREHDRRRTVEDGVLTGHHQLARGVNEAHTRRAGPPTRSVWTVSTCCRSTASTSLASSGVVSTFTLGPASMVAHAPTPRLRRSDTA